MERSKNSINEEGRFLFCGGWNFSKSVRVGPTFIREMRVVSFVHLVLNYSSAYTVFCLHGCFSKVSKNRASRGPPVVAVKFDYVFSGQILSLPTTVLYGGPATYKNCVCTPFCGWYAPIY